MDNEDRNHTTTQEVDMAVDLNDWPHQGWWERMEERAREMTIDALWHSRLDCIEAGRFAWELEKGGCPVTKPQGRYIDESTVYAMEMDRRRGARR
jgi:hypothetical protein